MEAIWVSVLGWAAFATGAVLLIISNKYMATANTLLDEAKADRDLLTRQLEMLREVGALQSYGAHDEARILLDEACRLGIRSSHD